MKYNMLEIISQFKDAKGFIYYKCKCDCGKEVVVYRSNLISGKTKSCGCLRKKILHNLYVKKNKFVEKDNYVIGYATNNNQEFYIDKDDYEKVKNISWYMQNNGYIVHKDTQKKIIQLHRFIMNSPKDKVIDHINHNRADNRKTNLKICSQKENCLNRKQEPKGIIKVKRGNNYYYIVQLNGYKGCYKDYEKAKKIRDDVLRERKDDRV